jgi:hypothetical protein
MLIKIFTLRFSEHLEGFDDGLVRNFMINNNIDKLVKKSLMDCELAFFAKGP